MPRFLYTVWFRDPAANAADQDHEWPACLLIEAGTAEAALAWGDHLARGRAGRGPAALFLWSEVAPSEGAEVLPLVRDGEAATDREIGW
ncbi:hypothetical protein ACLBXM_09645 [Xanthobacteraceae bacterium A53D]